MSPYVAPGIPMIVKGQVRISWAQVIEVIVKHTTVPLMAMQTADRRREYVYARQLAMYFIRNKTTMSLNEIGRLFGGRHHTSVIHSCNLIKDLMFSDEKVRRDVNLINGMF